MIITNSLTYSIRRAGLAICLGLLQTGAVALHGADTTTGRMGQLTASDYKFAKTAAVGGAMEVNLGKLASEKSTNPSVQQFGQKMVADHGKAGEQLTQIATKFGATLPTALSTAQQKEVEKLGALSGEAFDKEYVDMMVKDHKKDLKEFQDAAKNASNPELKEFAQTTSQTIQGHLTMIEDIQKQLRNVKTTASNQ